MDANAKKVAALESEAEAINSFIALFESRVKRIKEGDFDNVRREEYTEYPLLPLTSRMYYFHDGVCGDDFPGYQERVAKWKFWSIKGLQATTAHDYDRAPCALDFNDIARLYANKEREWAAQVEFTEAAIRDTTYDLIGYWYRGVASVHVLNTLASRSGCAVMLMKGPINPEFPWQYNYSELDDGTSKLHARIKEFRDATSEAYGVVHKFELSCVFMLDFDPIHIFKVRRMFPRARIVGIATPYPSVLEESTQQMAPEVKGKIDSDILATLKMKRDFMARQQQTKK